MTDHPFDEIAIGEAIKAFLDEGGMWASDFQKMNAARIEALEEALKDAQGVLMTRNQQIEELRDRLALLNETQSH